MIGEAPYQIFFFGNNKEGQAGIAHCDENILLPVSVSGTFIDCTIVSRVVLSQKQSYFCNLNGTILSCGENDLNELGRSGKRSLLQRIDSLEAFQIVDIACGDNFVIMALKDGRVVSWGRNDFGQLGNGNRENKEKPRPNILIQEGVLQMSAGSQHIVCISRSGTVFSWGGNRKGQLGDGQLTSSCVPVRIAQLRHRPIVSISCGESHTLALTVGGNIYAWGDNGSGQLGVGDNTHRLRPELISDLRAARGQRISAGRQHSVVVSMNGLLFSFGSNSHGQCGWGSHIRSQNIPTVVEKLRELVSTDVCCGGSHTLILCSGESHLHLRLFGMGLNSSGQLGLGHTNNAYEPVAIRLTSPPAGFSSGPLAYHSFVFTEGIPCSRPALPAVDLLTLRTLMRKCFNPSALAAALPETGPPTGALRVLRETIMAAFSSIAVLNASFRPSAQSPRPSPLSHGLSIDLETVRAAYDELLATKCDAVHNSLARATLQMAESLAECPFDDPENLTVFLIVLENPLLLQPQLHHVALERVVNGILALPSQYRITLFTWLRSYPSHFFCRVLNVLQGLLRFAFSREGRRADVDPTPSVLVLQSLFQCNRDAEIVPRELFYCPFLAQAVDLTTEWGKYLEAEAAPEISSSRRMFNWMRFPFLIDLVAKEQILRLDFVQRQQRQKQIYLSQHLLPLLYSDRALQLPSVLTEVQSRLPCGLSMAWDQSAAEECLRAGQNVYQALQGCCTIHLLLSVRRDELLSDLLQQLRTIVTTDADILKLSLRAEFVGEPAADLGGVAKELLSLACQQLLADPALLRPCGDRGAFVWFAGDRSCSRTVPLQGMREYYLGLLVGLASYNRILVNVPLPAAVYKTMAQQQLLLSDLWAVDVGLAQGLQHLLDFRDDDQLLVESFGATFTSSDNPLLDSHLGDGDTHSVKRARRSGPQEAEATAAPEGPHYIELRDNGNCIAVDKGNRAEFVRLFVEHSLYGSRQREVEAYICGVRAVFCGPATALCSHAEIESLLCGCRDIGELSLLRTTALYRGVFTDSHPIIHWLWDVLRDFSTRDKRRFLHFLTGSDRVPVGGLGDIRLTVQATGATHTSLPVAHTCFNLLDLPDSYESKDELQTRLMVALDHCEGFGLV